MSTKTDNPIDPIHQFEIVKLVDFKLSNVDLSFTNSSLFMVISILLISSFFILSTSRRSIIPNKAQLIAEMCYEFIAGMIDNHIGSKGKVFFPFVFTLFMFILLCNFIGLVPYSFTVTSHIIVTFSFAGFIFLGVTLLGFIKHGVKFLRLFCPPGIPIFLAPLLVPIELISYLSRPVSLSVRLAANMIAGHSMMKIFAGFVVVLGIYGIAPLVFVILLYALETIIAFLQAYVFAVLTCLYISDSYNSHH